MYESYILINVRVGRRVTSDHLDVQPRQLVDMTLDHIAHNHLVHIFWRGCCLVWKDGHQTGRRMKYYRSVIFTVPELLQRLPDAKTPVKMLKKVFSWKNKR